MHSIRATVFSSLCMVLAAFFALVGGFAFFLTRSSLRQLFFEDHARAVEFITRNIQSNFHSDLAALDELASLDGLSPFDARRADRLLAEFLKFDNVFGSVLVYRADGKLLLDRRRDSVRPYRPKDDFRKVWEPNFIRTAEAVLASGKSQVTQTFRRTKGDLYQAYLVPLLAPGDGKAPPRVVGFLSGAIFYGKGDLDYLVKGLRLQRDNFILLTDTRGHVLAQDGVGDDRRTKLLAPEIQQATEGLFVDPKRRKGQSLYTATFPLDRGSTYTIFSGAIEELKLTLTLGASWEAVRTKELQFLKWLFAGMMGGFILCFFASLLIAEKLSRPFGLLTTAAKAIDAGDFSVRVPADEATELGFLCGMMNRLGHRVEKGRLLGHLWQAEPD